MTGNLARRVVQEAAHHLLEDQRVHRDLELLSQLLRSIRDMIPPELADRLADALKELLLAIRAVLDYCVERLELRARSEPLEVQDIPISWE